ncbi:g9634 [Coccomyxa viridis]|uniref:G9634 protein n=1 Tax=Coccomyxa viridis TaxID=1274662 RepID=A0ABP1G4S6_9CHLO
MFKKKAEVLTSRPLSGKDVKALKRRVEVSFPDLFPDDIDLLFPAKSEVQLIKMKNRATAYTCNGPSPLFFDPEGRGDLLVPTCYAMWRFPRILDKLYTYSEVSPKVLGGADLFLQGLITPEGGLGHFSAEDLRAVSIPQNAYPFAVGTMEVSSDDVAKTGLKGKGLKLLHHYPDQLWAMGDKSVPNAGFTPVRIFPQDSASNGSAAPAQADVAGLSLSDDSSAQATDGHANADRAAAASTAAAAAPSAAKNEAEEPNSEQASIAAAAAPLSQDELIEVCLLEGLHAVTDGELPMLTSDFYAKHMLPAKPEGASMDIKKSSYKKLSKLLSTFEKKGLLTIKVIHKQDKLASVNREHKLYLGHTSAPAPAGATSAPSASAAAARADAAPSSSGRITVSFSYRVPSSLRPVFGPSAEQDRDALYSEAQVQQALLDYREQQHLAAPGGCIKLDRLLIGGLFNKKEEQKEGDVHPLDDTLKRLLSKLQVYHTISRPTPTGVSETLARGNVKNIVISMEDRMGGRKHLTHLSHVEGFGLDPDELAAVLQKKWSTSCSVNKLPGKTETGKMLDLQGNLLKELPKFLTEEYGIDPQYIDVKTKG